MHNAFCKIPLEMIVLFVLSSSYDNFLSKQFGTETFLKETSRVKVPFFMHHTRHLTLGPAESLLQHIISQFVINKA